MQWPVSTIFRVCNRQRKVTQFNYWALLHIAHFDFPTWRNSYVPEGPAQFEFCASRYWVCVWSTVHAYTYSDVVRLFAMSEFVIELIPVAAPSKAWMCEPSLAEITGSNPTASTDVCPFECCVCCQLHASATVQSPVQMNPTECVCVCHWVCSRETITFYTYDKCVHRSRAKNDSV